MDKDKTLLFAQREGYEELPPQLRLGELPDVARMKIWNVLYLELDQSRDEFDSYLLADPWGRLLRGAHAWHFNLPLNEWDWYFNRVCGWLREYLRKAEFYHVFSLIEYIMRHRDCPSVFTVKMHFVFKSCRLAYMVDVSRPPTIFPATTREEGEQLTRSLDELRKAGLSPSTVHLQQASKCVLEGNWAGSVRESIQAVESVARQITPNANTLGKALSHLEKHGVLQHKALKEALDKLYGYTSSEQGIRHALLDRAQPNVTEDEAVFMLGACASFASYLWRKHQAASAS